MQAEKEEQENRAEIDLMIQDMADVSQCLQRQIANQKTERLVLEMYCQQFTYVAHIPAPCSHLFGAAPVLTTQYAWPPQ